MGLYGQRVDETGIYVSGSQSEFALSSRDLLIAVQTRGGKDAVVAWVTRVIATAIETPQSWIRFDFDETTGVPTELSFQVPE